MRAILKGHIRFSLVTIPILVYNAVATEQAISFHLLHRKDHDPIGCEKRCKKCHQVVPAEAEDAHGQGRGEEKSGGSPGGPGGVRGRPLIEATDRRAL